MKGTRLSLPPAALVVALTACPGRHPLRRVEPPRACRYHSVRHTGGQPGRRIAARGVEGTDTHAGTGAGAVAIVRLGSSSGSSTGR